MIIITFPNGADWYKANWVFRQLVEDVVKMFPADTDLRFLMEQADALGGLSLDSMDDNVASGVMEAVKVVAETTLQGQIPGWQGKKPTDADGQHMYVEALSELLDVIGRQPVSRSNES